MFRLFFEPTKETRGTDHRDKMVLDKVFEDFNDFNIDLDRRVLRVSIKPNTKNGYYKWDEMMQYLKEGWDVYKLSYRLVYPNGSLVEIDIPEGYTVRVVLK